MSKTALVTGASSGIGRSIALRLAKDGYTVLVHYNSNEAGALETLSQLREFAPDSRTLPFDVSDSEQVEKALKEVEVQVLVNNAGLHVDGMAVLMSNDAFEKVISANLMGPFYVTKILAKKMLLKRKGCIVNISSLAGQTGNPGQANYASSKAGLIALTKTLSKELGPRGIRVNGVAPGLIETEMISTIPSLDELKKQIPLGRFGQASEVAGVVSFLCSEDASYINGHTISVNGGLYPS
ncbi:MAG TPA: 3-oxoacyl-ACP reductase FabG [Pseudobdellovibrionaceae bacterium]|nr:3-oxoacyl-ACP reductase FabG [Pseudobdellovibrionaceae bacterium]